MRSPLGTCLGLSLALSSAVARADGPIDPPDKGGTRLEALSLPTGPGSLGGMGEQVLAEPATGALTLSIPVALPPGLPGVEPDLTLRYDSRAGNGPLGIGWSIAPMNVQRRTTLGLPRYDDTDQLLWSGQRLLEIERGVFRQRVEGEFTRVVALETGYRADRKDGTKILLGTSPRSQVVQEGHVFRWLPDRAVSVHGDTADYLYAEDGPQRYLTEIDMERSGAPSSRIALRYEGRPDVLPDARAGFVVMTARRLAEIDTFVDSRTLVPVRSVRLAYDDSSGLSRLRSVQTCAGDGSICLPAVTFAVTEPSFAAAAAQSLTPPGVSLGDANTALVDVDGDSLPDVVRLTAAGMTWWHNLGSGGFAPGQSVSGAPGVELSSAGAAFQDMDGDGKAELLFWLGSSGEDGAVYAPAFMSGGTASVGPEVSLSGTQGLPPNGANVRWIDLDGNGRVDALRATPASWTAWFNLGEGELSAPIALTPPEAGLSFEDPTLRLADMNGDGLVDLVRLQSGIARVYLNLGFGSFAPGQDLAGAPDVGADDLRLYLSDADGDGLTDVLYVAPGRLSIWRNVGAWGAWGARGNPSGRAGFGTEIVVGGAPDYDPLTTTIRLADLLGHGVRGVVYSGEVDGAPYLWFLDPTSGVRPNLIVDVDNGFGGTRSVEFESTGQLMADAAAAGAPFAAAVPFPVSVVTSLSQADGVSPIQLEEHGYRDPYYDPTERLFQGFAQVQTLALGDEHAAGLRSTRTLHTGENEDLCLAGKTRSEEARSWDGTLLQRTVESWEAQPVATSLEGEPVSFAAEVQEDIEHWEGARSPKTQRVRRSYDLHGNLVEEDDEGWIGATPDPDSASIHLAYAEDEGPWILGKLAEREVLDSAGRRSSDERHFYDGAALLGLPLGQITLGDEARTSAWIADQGFADVCRFARDAYGNPNAWLDADGRRVEVDYDPERHQFPLRERHFPEPGTVLQFELSVDAATGQLVSYAEPDGSVTLYGWDGLGRLSSIQRPTDPAGNPGETVAYRLEPTERSITHARRSTPGGSFDVRTTELFDGFLRPLASVQSAERPGQLAILNRVARDARGNVAVQFDAFFASSENAAPSDGLAATQDFRDALGRLVHRVLPAGGELLWVPRPGSLDSYDSAATQGEAEASRATFDWRGEPIAIELDPGGPRRRHFLFERDPEGRVVRRTSPLGAVAIAAHDGLGRLTSLKDPDIGTISNVYDGAGHLTRRVDARGAQLLRSYDQAGRLLEESDAAGSRARYCYDDPIACGAGSSSPGRLLAVTDRSGTTTFGYDANGRVVSTAVTQGGQTYATSYELDGADRLTRLHYPDGTSLSLAYGGRDLVTAIPSLLEDATYTASGLPLTRTFANGLSIDLSRDAADRTVGVEALVRGTEVVRISYQLRPSGAPLARVDLEGTTTFALDDAERLTSEVGPRGTRAQEFDDDDRLSGRWAVPEDGRLPGRQLGYGAQAGPHALSTSARGAISYDAAGDRIREGSLELSWDAAGQLTEVTSPELWAHYVYGFDGSRRTRTSSGQGGNETALSFGNLIEIRDGVLWKHVVINGERIASLLRAH